MSPAQAADRRPGAITKQVQKSLEIVKLVEAFTKAQHDVDQAQLLALTANSYENITDR